MSTYTHTLFLHRRAVANHLGAVRQQEGYPENMQVQRAFLRSQEGYRGRKKLPYACEHLAASWDQISSGTACHD